jgi:hypothetical protein
VPEAIFKRSVEVANRLAERGTSRKLMVAVVEAMHAAKSECTDYDPVGSRGWRAWQMGTRRNREVHIGIGDWKKDETDQVPSIVSKKLGIRIVVCNTDDGTCIEDSSPQNCSKRGVGAERAVDTNLDQLSLFEKLDSQVDKVVSIRQVETSEGSMVTFYLCVHIEGDEVRAELSCPIKFESGYFGKFVERIFIVGGNTPPEEAARKNPTGDGDSDYDIPVKLKKQN